MKKSSIDDIFFKPPEKKENYDSIFFSTGTVGAHEGTENKNKAKTTGRQKVNFDPEAYERELAPWIPKNPNKVPSYVIGLLPNGEHRKVPTEKISRYISESKISVPAGKSKIPVGPEKSSISVESSISESTGKSKLYVKSPPLLVPTNPVKEKNFSIREGIKSIQKDLKNTFRECPKLSGLVTQEQFEQCLDIYENNQVYYQQKFEDHVIDEETFKKKISVLEEWFICIIEPKPNTRETDEIIEWREREKDKLKNLYSSYCDPDLYEYLIRPSDKFTKYITACHSKINDL